MLVKNLLLVATLFALQVFGFFITFWLVWPLYDCSGSFSSYWQCTSNSNPLIIPYAVFALAPPLLAKLVFKWLEIKVSWKKIIAFHILIAIILIIASWWLDPLNHPSGV